MDWFYIHDLLIDYGIFCIMALGAYFTLSAHQISLGHGALAGIGGYLTAILSTNLGVPVAVSISLAALCGALGGLIVAYFIALRLKGMYLAIGTFAFGEAMVVLWFNWEYVGGALGFLRIPYVHNIWLIYGILAVLTYALWSFERSTMVIAFRAAFDDEVTAASFGINVRSIKIMAWGVGGFVTALGGALFAHSLSVVRPDNFAFAFSIMLLLAPCIGGFRTFWGTYLGAAVIVFLPHIVNVADPINKRIFFGLAYIALMLWRPEGVIGRQGLRLPEWLRRRNAASSS